MKIEDLKIVDCDKPGEPWTHLPAVLLSDLPIWKTEPPGHSNLVLLDWTDITFNIGSWHGWGRCFVGINGIVFRPQPNRWCELLIPKKDDGWELAHHGLTGE